MHVTIQMRNIINLMWYSERGYYKVVAPDTYVYVNVYAIIIVLCISIDKSIITTRSLRNTHSQET
jgi:hypothetical protein